MKIETCGEESQVSDGTDLSRRNVDALAVTRSRTLQSKTNALERPATTATGSWFRPRPELGYFLLIVLGRGDLR
jgi:hypothetical protein